MNHSQHDHFFKLIIKIKKNARSFFNHYLPEELREAIDLSTLELKNDSFVDEKLKETFSDTLYQVKYKNKPAYLYLLFDHKSKPDKYVALQLLRYIISIWLRHLETHKMKGKLPYVFPIVFYHGKHKWRYHNDLKTIIEVPEGLEEFSPNF